MTTSQNDESIMSPLFAFKKIPHVISELEHFKIQEACTHYMEAIRVVGQGACNGRFYIEDTNLFELLSLPTKYLEWFKYFSKAFEIPLVSRPDFILTTKGPKLIDPNFCSTVGYVPEVSWLAHYQRQNSIHSKVRLLDPAEALFHHISSRIFPDTSLLVIKLDEAQCSRKERDLCISCFLKSISDFDFVCANFSELEERADGLYFKGKRYNNLLFSYQSAQIFEKWDEHEFLWKLQKKGLLNLLDNPFEAVLSNKVLLAFISEFAEHLPLASNVKENLTQVVPWSRYVRVCETLYNGESHSLERLLIKEKDRFVLKLSSSFQGLNVCIGKFYDSGDWASLVASSFQNPGWIAQEYLHSQDAQIEAHKDNTTVQFQAKVATNPYLVGGVISGYLNHYIPEENYKRNIALHYSGAGVIGTTGIAIPG